MAPEDAVAARDAVATKDRRRSALRFGLLVAGLGVAALLGLGRPRAQPVRFMVGGLAPELFELDLEYVDEAGDVARDARLAYAPGAAPRVVAHEPELKDGPYKVRVNATVRGRRIPLERSVILEGGATQIDLEPALRRELALATEGAP